MDENQTPRIMFLSISELDSGKPGRGKLTCPFEEMKEAIALSEKGRLTWRQRNGSDYEITDLAADGSCTLTLR
jgi:hypothetical protein